MNRISVRGVGMAAAALAATSLTVGGFTASADQAATAPVADASLVNLNNSSNAISDHAETASFHYTAASVVLRIETRAALAKAAQAKAKAAAAHASRSRLLAGGPDCSSRASTSSGPTRAVGVRGRSTGAAARTASRRLSRAARWRPRAPTGARTPPPRSGGACPTSRAPMAALALRGVSGRLITGTESHWYP